MATCVHVQILTRNTSMTAVVKNFSATTVWHKGGLYENVVCLSAYWIIQCTYSVHVHVPFFVGSKRPIRSLRLEDLNGKHSGTGKTQEPKFSQYKMWTHPMFKAWPHLTSAPKVSDLIKSIHLESAQECHGQRAGKYMEVPRPIPPLSLSFSLCSVQNWFFFLPSLISTSASEAGQWGHSNSNCKLTQSSSRQCQVNAYYFKATSKLCHSNLRSVQFSSVQFR